MIDKAKLSQIAEVIAESMDINQNDCVCIGGGEHAHSLLDKLRTSIVRRGAGHNFYPMTDDYGLHLFYDSTIPMSSIKKTPLYYDYLLHKATKFIYCDWFADPSILSNAPQDKRDAWSEAKKPIRDLLHHGVVSTENPEVRKNVKWLYFYWPSEPFAKFHNINYPLLENAIVNGMSVPSEEMEIPANFLLNNLEGVKKLHITDEKGSDFWISVEGRQFFKDTGTLSELERGMNLPAGEIYIAPIETKGEGVLFCPLTNDKKSNKIITNVELPFKEGKLQLEKVSADTNRDSLIKTFNHCERLDRKSNYPAIRTRNIAEWAIGLNPEITAPIGYQLTDEKIRGSVHLAVGWNDTFGGNSLSDMHWDFVSHPSATVEVEYVNGKKLIIMEKGEII